MFEKTLAYFCAPALAGIKPSNLVSLQKAEIPDVHAQVMRFNETFSGIGICAEILCECDKRALVILYRPALLEKTLAQPEIRQLLARYGYAESLSLEEKLSVLKEHLTHSEFPHEIGAFLGYPAADIDGFIRCHGKGRGACRRMEGLCGQAKGKGVVCTLRKLPKGASFQSKRGKKLSADFPRGIIPFVLHIILRRFYHE